MKCLETRRTPEGFKRRRYEAPTGERLTTIEVPVELWTSLYTPPSERLRSRVMQLVSEGWKVLAIAHEVGLAPTTIHRWVREHRAEEPT